MSQINHAAHYRPQKVFHQNTHCYKGHPLPPTGKGERRFCKVCRYEKDRIRRAMKKTLDVA